jgi:hypothetical protein
MYSNGTSGFIEFNLMIILWKEYNSRIMELWGQDCSNHVVPLNVRRSWLLVHPHTIFCYVFSCTLLDKDAIHRFG